MGLRDPLPTVPLTYAAWGEAERAYWTPAELEKRAGFWQSELTGRSRLWDALEGPATARGPHHRRVTYFPPALADAAQELARIAGATLYSTLLAAFQVALSRWTGRTDILVGTPVANRANPAVRETMGYCAGIVPLRVQIDPAMHFAASLRSVHQKSVDCSAHAMPFVELAKRSGRHGGSRAQSRLRGAFRVAESSRARRDAARTLRAADHALHRHGALSPRLRDHRGRRRVWKSPGFTGRSFFRTRKSRISSAFTPQSLNRFAARRMFGFPSSKPDPCKQRSKRKNRPRRAGRTG